MAQTLDLGLNSTGNVNFNLACEALDFPAVTAKKSGGSTDELILINTQSPSDRINTITQKAQRINIYKGTSVNPAYRNASDAGIQLMQRRDEPWAVLDSAVPEFRVDLPAACWIVVKLPLHALVTDTVVQGLIARTVSQFFESDRAATPAAQSRISALMRGSLVPSGM